MSKAKVWTRIVDKDGSPLEVLISYRSNTARGLPYESWSNANGWDKTEWSDYNHGHTVHVYVGGRRIGDFVVSHGLEQTFRISN